MKQVISITQRRPNMFIPALQDRTFVPRVILALGLFLNLATFSTVMAQTAYQGDGEPTAVEEEIRWLLNRARFSRTQENQRLTTNYSDIPESGGPLAPNAKLIRAARRHSEDMAKLNQFQHETVTGSAYYNAKTQPGPGQRIAAEGYNASTWGENIAAGYDLGAFAYYLWWTSGGHRKIMCSSSYGEVGIGNFVWAPSDFGECSTMAVGSQAANRFFTGTIFSDANQDNAYSAGEGRPGVKAELRVGAVTHTVFDVSTAVGSFAIPLVGIAQGATVKVQLINTTASTITLSIPRSYATLESIVLTPGESRVWGQFNRSSTARNYGFRDAIPPPPFLSVAPEDQTFGPASTSGSLSVDANVAWTAQSSTSWLRITGSSSGNGPGTLTYIVDANTFGDPRTTQITLAGGPGLTSAFEVTQNGVPTILEAGSAPIDVSNAGSSGTTAPVTANVTWTASESAHWISLLGSTTSVGSASLRFDTAPNSSSIPREAAIQVSGGGQIREILVRQAAGAVRGVAEWLQWDPTEGGGTLAGVTGLPTGLIWDRSTGFITGRSQRSGTFRVQVTVRDLSGALSKRVVSLVIQPLPTHAVGSFEGRLAFATSLGQELGGVVRGEITAAGLASGTLSLTGKRHSWRGFVNHVLGQEPELSASVVRKGEESVSLKVRLAASHHLAGTAETSLGSVPLTGWRRIWKLRSAPVPEAVRGRYHVHLNVGATWLNQEAVPQGTGFAVLTIGTDGGVKWTGRAGEGSSFTQSGVLGPLSETAFWQSLHGQQGAVAAGGTVQTANSTFSGNGLWRKKGPSSSRDRLYPAGFGTGVEGPVALELTGGRWQTPARGQSLVDTLGLSPVVDNLSMTFLKGVTEDTVTPSPTCAVTLTTTNRVQAPPAGSASNPWRLTAQISASTGRVWGNFELRDPPAALGGKEVLRRVSFDGLCLPSGVAGGYFLGPKLPNPVALPSETLSNTPMVSGLMRFEPRP